MAQPMPLPTSERPASEGDYQPVSGVAAAAIVVASIFLAIVLVTAVLAFWNKRPAMNDKLLYLAVLAIGLSIAARLHIRRSENTRTGLKLASVAWWISVIGGVAFAAYIYGNIVALRQQSTNAASAWFELLKTGKHSQAFLITQPPMARQGVNADSEAELDSRFGAGPLPGFRNSELVRFFQRNGEEVTSESLGMSNWEQVDGGFRVELSYRLRSGEGTFQINLNMMGLEGKNVAGREWQIGTAEGSLIPLTRTTYGRLVLELQDDAFRYANAWLDTARAGLLEDATVSTLTPNEQSAMLARIVAKRLMWFSGPPFAFANVMPSIRKDPAVAETTFKDLSARDFFRFEGSPFLTEDKKKTFQQVWNIHLFHVAGRQRLQNPDRAPQLTIASDRIEYALPVEIALPGVPTSFSRARLILVSDSPQLVEQVNDLRKKGKAQPDVADTAPQVLPNFPAPEWRVLRLESNLEALPAAKQQGQP